jgi:archaellum component FlaC
MPDALLRAKASQVQKIEASIEKANQAFSLAAGPEGGNSVVKDMEAEVHDLEAEVHDLESHVTGPADLARKR